MGRWGRDVQMPEVGSKSGELQFPRALHYYATLGNGRYTLAMPASSSASMVSKPKKRPPAALFALGHAALPLEIDSQGVSYRFVKLFKHDFFAATGLYQR